MTATPDTAPPLDERPTSRAPTIAIAVGTLAVILALGEALPRLGVVNRTVLPTPSDAVRGLFQLMESGYWLEDLRKTLFAVAVAWVVGSLAGLGLGIAMGVSPFVRAAVAPYAIAVQALPKIVLAPLFIGWLGFGSESKIAIAVAICFFPVWVDTMVGLWLPGDDEFTLMRSLRASRWQVFRMLQFPSAIPLIMVGIKHAALLAFTGVLVAEILAPTSGGLGTLAKEFSLQLNMPLTVAIIGVVIVLAVVMVSILDWIEQRVVFWSEAAQERAR